MHNRLAPLGFLALLVTSIGLYLALRHPAPQRFDIGVPGDAFALINAYGPEQNNGVTYRWSGRGASLLLAGSFDGPQQLAIRLQGNAALTQTLTISRDDLPIATVPIMPAWRVYRVMLPPDTVFDPSAQEPLLLDIPTARPGPGDPRDLGAAIDWAEVVPLAADTSLQPLLTALLLTWLLALLVGVSYLWGRTVLTNGKPFPMVYGAGLLAAAGTALVVWAYRAPAILSWALPLSCEPLLLASVALALLWLLSRSWKAGGRRQEAGGNAIQSALPPAASAASVLPPAASAASALPPASERPASCQRAQRAIPLLALFVLHVLMLTPWRDTAAALLLFVPGALLAWALTAGETDSWEQLFAMICGGAAVFALLLFSLQALPGPLPWWLLLAFLDALILTLLWYKRIGSPSEPHRRTDSPAHPASGASLTLILALAAFLRLWNLGAGEFQGDEARAILLANGLYYGYENILLSHTKGPGEVLFPAGPLALTGYLGEFAARLPFAIAGIGVVLGAFVLARRLFAGMGSTVASHAGLVAALVLATDGLLIGFSRIVQYQSIVMLCMAGALWCCWRFAAAALTIPNSSPSGAGESESSRQSGTGMFRVSPPLLGGGGGRTYLICAAVLLAVGLLAHYDAAAVAPALALLVAWGGWRAGWRGLAWLRNLWLPVLIGAGLLLSFYLPFVLNERFGRTAEYLAGRTGEGDGGGFLFNNLPLYFQLLTVYNTTFQVYAAWIVLLLGLTLVNVACSRQHTKFRAFCMLHATFSILLLITAAISAWQPGWLQLPNGINIALFGFGLPMLWLIMRPGIVIDMRVALLFFTVPFLAMGFVIAEPRTHFYTMHIGGALLIGVIVGQWAGGRGQSAVSSQQSAGDRRQEAGGRRQEAGGLSAIGYRLSAIILLLLVLPYLDLAFLRLFPEYRRTFPAARPALYRSSFGDTLPEGGYFGFPRRDGWKALAQLYATGELQGSYDASQNGFLTGWYMRGAPQCKSDPDYYFISVIEQQQYIPTAYHLIGELYIGPLRTVDIYGKEPVATVRRYQLSPADTRFDAAPVPDFALGPALDELTPKASLDAQWQAGARLRGYDRSAESLAANEQALITLYWQANAPLSRAVTPLLLLRDATGNIVRELRPSCADFPAALWTARYVSPVQYHLLAQGLAAGEYTIHAALREEAQTLPLVGGASDTYVGTLHIAGPTR
jgi:4-amino-4-deoxy-L-arabinose transferase-like glycosyltransferase